MTTRLLLIHSWGSSPEDHWYPWLAGEAAARGLEVLVPAMPEPETPRIEAWVPRLRELLAASNAPTLLVGHSIGCQTLLRALAAAGRRAERVVLVAPWLALTGIGEEERAIATPWVETPVDAAAVRAAAPSITAFFSSNDPYVPVENEAAFRERFGARVVRLDEKGHFDAEDGVTEAPFVLEALGI